MTTKEAPQLVVGAAVSAYGGLDVWFNNAGIVGINVDIIDTPLMGHDKKYLASLMR